MPKKYSWSSESARRVLTLLNCYLQTDTLIEAVQTTLRLLQTFMGVLQRKIFICALFSKKPTQTIYQKIGYKMKNLVKLCFVLDFALQRWQAIDFKMTEWCSSELIGYQMWLFMQNNCAVVITKHQSPKNCQHFLLSLLVVFLFYSIIKEFA